ncbi:MAG: hypothetical protein H0X71_08525 [Rubrobacter sp.]|nr:hypothetical protein [Rubrobacter sp.]
MRSWHKTRGLSLRRGAGHVFRAIMESICYDTEHIFRSMRVSGFELKEVVTADV